MSKTRKRIRSIDIYLDVVYGVNPKRDQEWTVEQWKGLAQDLLKQRNNLMELNKQRYDKV